MDVQTMNDNYCLKLLNGFGAGATIGSTTKAKFITELRKLHASGYCLEVNKGKYSITNTHAENLRRQTTDFDNFINAIFKPKKKTLH
jgi:predicted transcriptional regulator